MRRDNVNVFPIMLALLLHATVFGALIMTWDLARNAQPSAPLAISATLVTDSAVVVPPPVAEPQPQPEPEPAVVEPEVQQPDLAEQARIEAEERKRQEDLRREQARLEELRQQEEAERQRQAEAEARRKHEEAEARRKREEEEAKRRAEEEAELERRRKEAERRRQEEIERQREENERQRLALEAEQRQAEIEAEQALLAARNSNEMAAYQFAIRQKVQRNWVKPASARPGLECVVRVRQTAGGEVLSAAIVSCNGDEAVQRSIVAAIRKASPLPLPSNPLLFESDLRFVFKPEQ